MDVRTETNSLNGRAGGQKSLGPDIMSIEQLHKVLKFDEVFQAEFNILSPHLRKITRNWAAEIPIRILEEESHQDSVTIRDLNGINLHVKSYVDAMYSGRFYEGFESPLDGIAIILKNHSINPGWATVAFSMAFDKAQQQLFFETRQVNARVFPAALRCLTKIMVLTIHILNRRDHELNDVTPQQGAKPPQ